MEENTAMRPWFPMERQIIESSVWEADYRVRILWVTMLAIASEAGRQGVIDMTIRSLAGRACMPPDDTRFALGVLLEADPSSRNPAHDGRRLEKLDDHREWGWRVLNWSDRKDAHDRAIDTARKRRQRDRDRILNELQESTVTQAGHTVTDSDALSREIEKEREKEKEKETKTERERPTRKGTPGVASKVGPTREEWVQHARATWPRWPEHGVRSAWAWHQTRGWKGVVDWRASAEGCFERWAGDHPELAAAPVAVDGPAELPYLPPDLVPIDEGAWAEIRVRIRAEMDERDMQTWVDPLRQVGQPNGRLVLWWPGESRFLPWLTERFTDPITLAARACGIPIPDGVEILACCS